MMVVALASTLTDLEPRGPLVVPGVVPGVVAVVAEHELPELGALAAVASVVADVEGFSRVGPQVGHYKGNGNNCPQRFLCKHQCLHNQRVVASHGIFQNSYSCIRSHRLASLRLKSLSIDSAPVADQWFKSSSKICWKFLA